MAPGSGRDFVAPLSARAILVPALVLTWEGRCPPLARQVNRRTHPACGSASTPGKQPDGSSQPPGPGDKRIVYGPGEGESSTIAGGATPRGCSPGDRNQALPLPPASPDLLDDLSRPYFLWWTAVTVGELHKLLRDFPTRPLPELLVQLDEAALRRFRDVLAERLRLAALPGPVKLR